MKTAILAAIFVASQPVSAEPVISTTCQDNQLSISRTAFSAENWELAVMGFEAYALRCVETETALKEVVKAYSYLAKIYLEKMNEPVALTKFSNQLIATKKLSPELVAESFMYLKLSYDWRVVHGDEFANSPKQALPIGLEYYRLAKSRSEYPMDDSQSTLFRVAYKSLGSYFRSTVKGKRAAEALLALGDSETRLFFEPSFAYLIELIEAYPHTNAALLGWQILNGRVRMLNSGSSGDNTPPSTVRWLAKYRKMAFPKAKVKKLSKKVRKARGHHES